jgi:2-hydroxychromene-2-carboxylate isomerase
MRCATWAKRAGAVEPFARAVFAATFGDGGEISDPALLSAAAGQAGLDAQEMLRTAALAEIKGALRDATEHAWELGVRMAPSLRIGETVFYGDDQLELAASALGAAA